MTLIFTTLPLTFFLVTLQYEMQSNKCSIHLNKPL